MVGMSLVSRAMTPEYIKNKARKAILEISDEAKAARRPYTPEELVGTLEDRPHKDIGISRPAKSIRVKAK